MIKARVCMRTGYHITIISFYLRFHVSTLNLCPSIHISGAIGYHDQRKEKWKWLYWKTKSNNRFLVFACAPQIPQDILQKSYIFLITTFLM